MRTKRRFRYSLRGLLIVTAVLAVGLAHVRSAIRDYSAQDPYAWAYEDFLSQRFPKLASLALPTLFLCVGFWIVRKRYGPVRVVRDE